MSTSVNTCWPSKCIKISRYNYTIQIVPSIRYNTAEIIVKWVFFKDCFMHISHKFEGQNWSELIFELRTFLLYFYPKFLGR